MFRVWDFGLAVQVIGLGEMEIKRERTWKVYGRWAAIRVHLGLIGDSCQYCGSGFLVYIWHRA